MIPGDLACSLDRHALFRDLDTWKIERIAAGQTSPHTYRFRSGGTDIFVKHISDNERYTLSRFTENSIRVMPRVLLPELLEENILVTGYLPGGHHRGKQLDRDLLVRYAEMQNILNQPFQKARENPYRVCSSHERDDGTFREGLLGSIGQSFERLESVSTHKVPVLEQYYNTACFLASEMEEHAREFASMPFAWLHWDFCEENLVGNPAFAIDWGSSLGYGPFLHDLAPYLIGDPEGLEVFREHSGIAREHSPEAIRKWLHAATAAHFWSFILWHITEELFQLNKAEDIERILRYEYAPYRVLRKKRSLRGVSR